MEYFSQPESPLQLLSDIGREHIGGDERHALSFLMEPASEINSGIRWGHLTITWPDRVPSLKTWSGQQSLESIVTKYQEAIAEHLEFPKRRKKDRYVIPDSVPRLDQLQIPLKGTSGFDAAAAADPIDIGFSPNALGMRIMQTPALELLAIIGLELTPIISYAWDSVGVLYEGHVYRWLIEKRAGGYYSRWSHLVQS